MGDFRLERGVPLNPLAAGGVAAPVGGMVVGGALSAGAAGLAGQVMDGRFDPKALAGDMALGVGTSVAFHGAANLLSRGISRAVRSGFATEAARDTATASTAIERQWAHVPHNGFLGGWNKAETVRPGTLIDRYGIDTGRFFSPAAPFGARALPPGAGPLNAYEVLKPLQVRTGIAAPAFGQPGLGVQYMAHHPVADLIEDGFIKQVTP